MSIFNPKIQNNRHIDRFKKLVTKDLETIDIKTPTGQGHIKEGIKTLEKRKDLVIRQADKGGGIVAWNKSQYKSVMSDLLNDNETYKDIEGRHY